MSRFPEHFRRAPRPVSVAAIQMTCDWDADANIAKAERLVREAAARGAQIILLPDQFLRTRGAGVFQLHRDSRRGWHESRDLSQVAYSEWAGVPGKELLQPRGHGVQGVEYAFRAHWRGHLLGPVVSGDFARDGAARRGDPVLSDGDWHGAAARTARELTRALAAYPARAGGGESHAARGFQSVRARAFSAGSARALYPLLRIV